MRSILIAHELDFSGRMIFNHIFEEMEEMAEAELTNEKNMKERKKTATAKCQVNERYQPQPATTRSTMRLTKNPGDFKLDFDPASS